MTPFCVSSHSGHCFSTAPCEVVCRYAPKVQESLACGDIKMFAAVVLCECGKYRQHNRPHGFTEKESDAGR